MEHYNQGIKELFLSYFKEFQIEILIGFYVLFFILWMVNYYRQKKDTDATCSQGYYYFMILFLVLIDIQVVLFIMDIVYPFVMELAIEIENQWTRYLLFSAIVIGVTLYGLYLTKQIQKIFYLDSEEEGIVKFSIYFLLYFFVIASLVIFSVIIISILILDLLFERCEECDRRFTQKVINKTFIGERKESVKETDYIDNQRVERYRDICYKSYRITKKCIHCSHIRDYTQEEKSSCSGWWSIILGLFLFGSS